MTEKPKNPEDLMVRGVIAGAVSIPLSKIREMLQDALAPTDWVLAQITKAVHQISGGRL